MVSDFDDLESMVMADARKKYSEITIDHAMNPRNAGEMPEADGFGQFRGSCGDIMEVWIKVKDNKITKASFWSSGCGTSIASGSMITEMAKDKTIQEARQLTPSEVNEALGGLPEENADCPEMAAGALKQAISNYLKIQKEPWKKVYGNL